MAVKIKRFLKHFFEHRSLLMLTVFAVMSAILIARLFQLQIIHGSEYANDFTSTTTKSRRLKSTRGNIYDTNGRLIAYNELSNSVTIEDSGSYETTREKRLSLNGEIYRLIHIIEGNGDSLVHDFHITIDENNNYVFDVEEGTTRNRFRADIYGLRTIEEMTEQEKNSTPNDIMELLCSNERFGLYDADNPYTEEELAEHGLPAQLTRHDELEIIIVRYMLSLTSYQKFVQVTIAENVSDNTVAVIKENSDALTGVDIIEDSIRVYNYAECMGPIIGYTGRPSYEELEELTAQRSDYNSTSIVGKSGIELYMETTLQGSDGSEDVAVDNLGKVLGIYEDSRVEPRQGDDVYLTIDAELQQAVYEILEQRIAGILVSNIRYIRTVEDYDVDPEDESYSIPIPIYDVFNALIGNSIIDIHHFESTAASTMEQYVHGIFTARQQEVFAWIREQILNENVPAYNDLDEEYQAYMTYLIDDMLTSDTEVIKLDGDYYNDEVYISWQAGEISAREFLSYCISRQWIDLTNLTEEATYLSSDELYEAIVRFACDYMLTDTAYAKVQYKYMLFNDLISPEMLIQILFDQEIVPMDDDAYELYMNGEYSAADFMVDKISNLDITPKQLALDPCSGSAVITDPQTGQVRALVSYPGYDNNRLANTMDTDYYWQLYEDQSTPFYNKATLQLTAPGSTFKPVMAAAGLNEHVIDENTQIFCSGLFGKDLVGEADQLHCWYRAGHKEENVITGLANSCNVFFCTVGYMMGLDSEGVYNSERSLEKIRQYASYLNLDSGTNIQITESTPQVSDEFPIPSSIGQGTHLYTTTQLARFALTLCNNGTSYDLNLLQKVTDPAGNVLKLYGPVVGKQAQFGDIVWADIRTGMRGVVTSKPAFKDYPVNLFGKTGTAEESEDRPSHALFIGYSQYLSNDDIAFAVRIAYGYSSDNAVMAAKDILNYYYGLADETQILNEKAATEGLTSTITD